MFEVSTFAAGAVFVTVLIFRVIYLAVTPPKAPNGKHLRTMIVLGSGGHTAEMLRLVEAMRPEIYVPRIYVVAATDKLGTAKAAQAELQLSQNMAVPPTITAKTHEVAIIPRSREVGQSWSSSVITTAWAILVSIVLVFKQSPDVVLCNGPGTCIPIVLAAFTMRVLGLKSVHIIYIESIARVDHLSLTGKILYHLRLSNLFLVQWEKLADKLPRAKFISRLM
mmetsp:Transcript_26393/g.50130  ORF Transcript_26393/g.50130 Transcript_26393/m.50130 type:complete len:223 (+) Transcript_26393:236-904(+)